MSETANLALPTIEGAQAQKHVTHNEALRGLDAIVQLAVLDRDLSDPPASPGEGERWIVAAGASGAWSGHAGEIAAWQGDAWRFYVPRRGWLAHVVDEGSLLAWDGAAWVAALDILGGMLELQNLALLGVGTTADAVNPFSAKLNNALLAARATADGGDGDLRVKLSKESATGTASLLFQDAYSGRAEFGLTGDDDFRVKVSADGAAWHDALWIDSATGRIRIAQGFDDPGATRALLAAAPIEAMAAANLAINGDHVVSQQYVDSANTGIGSAGGVATYVTDQWQVRAKGSLRVSGQRATSAPNGGFKYSLLTTVTTAQASLGSGDYLQISQPIEGLRAAKLGFGAAGAASLSIGFWAWTSVAGTYCVQLTNSARSRAICKEATLPASAWTWVEFSGANAFPGDTTGTWLSDTGVGLRIAVTLAAGSALQGTGDAWGGSDVLATANQVNFAATLSAGFYMTGLVALAGTDLPPSDRAALCMQPFDRALSECQRYYQKSFPVGTSPAVNVGFETGELTFVAAKAGAVQQPLPSVFLYRPMRVPPTMSLYNPAGASFEVYDRTNVGSLSSSSAFSYSEYSMRVFTTGHSGVAVGDILAVHWAANARLS